jgi:ABC transport system ATP-binding/permease protein
VNLITLERVTRRYAEKLVLDEVSLSLAEGERAGIVGVNGSGKSTLLRIAARIDEPDSGRVVHANRVHVHYLPQEPALDPEHTAIEAVLAADTPRARTVREYERLMAILRDDPADAYATRHLHSLQAAMDAIEGWALEHRAEALLHRLGVADPQAVVGSRSGGQRKRIALARALLDVELSVEGGRAGVLVLDEPTNHLDVEAVEWLEGELLGSGQAILLVTHDRYLLDRVCTSLLVFEDEGRLHRHHGSWDSYLGRRDELRAAAEAAHGATAGRRRKERSEASRSSDRPSSGGPARLSCNERRELAGLEERIAELERERDDLGRRLADPSLYQEEGEEVARATRRFHEAEEALRAVYARWMELEERAG